MDRGARAAAALLALPAAAQATLAYVKNPSHPAVFAANDNGTGAFRVGPGSNPRVSPDGDVIAYQHEGSNGKRELKLAAAHGGGSATVLTDLQDSFYLAFSPDSQLVAALRGPELGKRKLVLIDVAAAPCCARSPAATSAASASRPTGTELVYSKANSEKYPPRSRRLPAPGRAAASRFASPRTTSPSTRSGDRRARSSSSSSSAPSSAGTARRTSSS